MTRGVPFVKMEGCGNDYVYLDLGLARPAEPIPAAFPDLARRLSDRRYGIGSDGLIALSLGGRASVVMRMWNADGSEGKLCLNGLRCAAKLAAGILPGLGAAFTMDTAAGPRRVRILGDPASETCDVEVEVGRPDFRRASLPALGAGEELWGEPFEAAGMRLLGYAVSVGNPHLVLVLPDEEAVARFPIEALAPLSVAERFPEGMNVHVVAPGEARVRMRTWERGSGATLACGSGAVAVYAVSRRLGPAAAEAEIAMPGGSVRLREGAAGLVMRGPAREVFRGTFPLR